MRVAIYARESLDDSEKAPPIENQIEIGKNWIDENHHELTEIFADDGWSGGNWKRPRWNEIVSQARASQTPQASIRTATAQR
jgi:DNA invertase Pin-like site-specific DNA recombinase